RRILKGCGSITPPTSNRAGFFLAMALLLVSGKERLGERHARDPVPTLMVVLADAAEFPGALLAHFRRGNDDLRAAGERAHLRPARELEEVVVDVGLGERGPAYQGAVILEDHRPLVAERSRQGGGAFRRGVVDFVRIVRDAVVEAHRLLRDGAQTADLGGY